MFFFRRKPSLLDSLDLMDLSEFSLKTGNRHFKATPTEPEKRRAPDWTPTHGYTRRGNLSWKLFYIKQSLSKWVRL